MYTESCYIRIEPLNCFCISSRRNSIVTRKFNLLNFLSRIKYKLYYMESDYIIIKPKYIYINHGVVYLLNSFSKDSGITDCGYILNNKDLELFKSIAFINSSNDRNQWFTNNKNMFRSNYDTFEIDKDFIEFDKIAYKKNENYDYRKATVKELIEFYK